MNINNKQQTTTKMFNSLEINSKTKHNNENVKLKKRKTEYSLSILVFHWNKKPYLEKKGNLFTFFSFVCSDQQQKLKKFLLSKINFFFFFFSFLQSFFFQQLSEVYINFFGCCCCHLQFSTNRIFFFFHFQYLILQSNKRTIKIPKCWLQKKHNHRTLLLSCFSGWLVGCPEDTQKEFSFLEKFHFKLFSPILILSCQKKKIEIFSILKFWKKKQNPYNQKCCMRFSLLLLLLIENYWKNTLYWTTNRSFFLGVCVCVGKYLWSEFLKQVLNFRRIFFHILSLSLCVFV